MKKICVFASLLLVVFSACGCAGAGVLEDGDYIVTRIIDGDTIEISGTRVRYLGIDTPETTKKTPAGWLFDPEPYALEAKRYNEELVLGKTVRIEFDTERYDKYGRCLCYVYTGDKMVNRELVLKGYARVLLIPPNMKYAELLRDAEQKARSRNIAIWER